MAAEAATVWAVSVKRFAVLAPTPAGARVLRRAIADAAFEPGYPLADLFYDGRTGAIADVAYAHSAQPLRVTGSLRRAAVQEYCARIRKSANIAPGDPAGAKFMSDRQRQASVAIGYLDTALLSGLDLSKAYGDGLERGLDLPNPTQWIDLADYWQTFKRRERAVEAADILTGHLYPDEACPLVLFDDADEAGPLARAAIERLFPRAALVITAQSAGCLGRALAGSFVL